jgi:hypothetical protein
LTRLRKVAAGERLIYPQLALKALEAPDNPVPLEYSTEGAAPHCQADLGGRVSELISQRRADCDRRQWMQAGVDDRSPLPLTVAS